MTVSLSFDTTSLSHFARAGQLEALEALTAPYRRITPSQVTNEIHNGIPDHPALSKILTAAWLEVVELQEVDELVAFAKYKSELGGGRDRNNGEAAVLAWTAVHGGVAIIDERAGARIGQRDGLDVHGTLWLVVNGFRLKQFTRAEAEHLVDQLVATDMALPVDGAGFFAWAFTEGLLP